MDPKHPWVELAEELGAEVHPSWSGSKVPIVQWRVADTVITADPGRAEGLGPSTRVRAFYVDDGSFRFGVHSARVSTELSKLFFGTQDLLVGDKSFDRRFVVRGSDEARIRALFGRPRILELLKGPWNLGLVARPLKKGWQEPYLRGDVDGLAEVVFHNSGILSSDRLRRVFELFHEILEELGVTAIADDHDVEVLISRLRARGGTLHGLGVRGSTLYGLLVWDGDIRRRAAAKLLGDLGDPQAVEALVEVLSDPDDALRPAAAEALGLIGGPRAVEALGEVLSDPDDALRLTAAEALGLIGDPLAVAPLSGLLADRSRVEGAVIAQEVARVLERLGAGELVDAFHLALKGQDAALRRCVQSYRARTPVAHALIDVMEGSELSAVEAAGQALGWLGVRDVLPELRRIEGMTGWDRSREACRETTAAIDSMDSLPRPANPVRGGDDTLPRPAGTHERDATTLPRAATEEDDDS
jgi:hypothetical protein